MLFLKGGEKTILEGVCIYKQQRGRPALVGSCCYSYRWGMIYRPVIQDSVMKFMRLKNKGTKHCTIVCRTSRQANKTCSEKLHRRVEKKKSRVNKGCVLIRHSVQLLVKTNSLWANDMETSQCISPCGRGEDWAKKLDFIWMLNIQRGRFWVFHKLLMLLAFSFSLSSPGFTEDGPGKRQCPVCGSCVEEHSHVDVRGSRSEGAD